MSILGNLPAGNLGDYQRFAEVAKSLGGVDKMVQLIEAAGAEKALEKLPAKFIVVGGLGLLVGAGAYAGGQKLYTVVLDRKARRAAIIADGELAASELAAIIDDPNAHGENGDSESIS